MADSYFDKLGWKKELVNQTSFVGTTVQINNGSGEVAGQTVITVDGGMLTRGVMTYVDGVKKARFMEGLP